MSAARLLAASALFSFALSGSAGAAGAQELAAPAPDAWFGLARDGERVIASSPSYEAAFDDAGVTYTAALGACAPVEQRLRIEARVIERDDARRLLSPSAPCIDDARVTYERGDDVSEIFDVDAHGIAQSFLVSAPLAGPGDLVVRCALTGNLAEHAVTLPSGGVEFVGAFGGVRVGAVTGIDADGRRCAGELRATDGVLELVLPGSFVDAATYPLLIDPLIGTVFPISNDSQDDGEPDLAYDVTTQSYLVVWRRILSASTSGIRGQRFDAYGAKIGGLLTLDAGSGATDPPKVANVHSSDRFFVVWTEKAPLGENLVGRSCDASNGFLSNKMVIATTIGDHFHDYEVAGEAQNKPEYAQALVVYRDTSSTPAIRCARVNVPSVGTPTATWITPLVTETPLVSLTDAPTISKTGGAVGVFLVAYRSRFLPFGGSWEISALSVDRDGFPTTPILTLTSNSVAEGRPRVDGGASLGSQFAVLYDREPLSLLRDLEVTTVKVAGGSVVKTGTNVVAQSLVKLSDYDLAWTPGRATAIWAERSLLGSNYNVATRDVDATNASLFGTAATTVANVTPDQGDVKVAIASIQSGGQPGFGNGLMALSYHRGFLTSGDVYGQLFDSLEGGSVIDQGGGCGAGGSIVSSGDASIGNGFFQLTLVGADALAPFTILNFSPPATPIGCGACAWLPFLAETVYPTLSGASQVVLQVPNDLSLVGHPIQAQFTTPTPTSSPCGLAPGFSLSNRVEILLGF